MLYGIYSLIEPVKFIQCGHFISDIGWQHQLSQRKKDTELLIGTKGVVSVAVNGKNFQLKMGDVLAVFPGDIIHGTKPTSIPSEFTWIHFVNQDHLQLTTHYPKENELQKEVPIPRFFHIDEYQRIMVLINQILDISHSNFMNNLAADYSVSGLLLELANDYFHQINNESFDENNTNRIKEWIRLNMNEHLTTEAVANHFNMSQDCLMRLFRNVEKKSVKEYLNEVRLIQAKFLLLTTDLSIQEIAYRSYFTDNKYFFLELLSGTIT